MNSLEEGPFDVAVSRKKATSSFRFASKECCQCLFLLLQPLDPTHSSSRSHETALVLHIPQFTLDVHGISFTPAHTMKYCRMRTLIGADFASHVHRCVGSRPFSSMNGSAKLRGSPRDQNPPYHSLLYPREPALRPKALLHDVFIITVLRFGSLSRVKSFNLYIRDWLLHDNLPSPSPH